MYTVKELSEMSQEKLAAIREKHFRTIVPIPHHVAIRPMEYQEFLAKTLQEKTEPKTMPSDEDWTAYLSPPRSSMYAKIPSYLIINQRLADWNISLKPLGILINRLDLWSSLSKFVSSELPPVSRFSLDSNPDNFDFVRRVLYLLNGNSNQLNYWELFPESNDICMEIVKAKYGKRVESMSTIDIFLAEILHRTLHNINNANRNKLINFVALIFNPDVEDDERIKAYQGLEKFSEKYPVPMDVLIPLNLAMNLASQTNNHLFSAHLRPEDLDLIGVFYSGVLEPACILATQLAREYPNARITPTGGIPPHQYKELKLENESLGIVSEAELMITIMMSEPYRSHLAGMPELGYEIVNARVSPDRICYPDSIAKDTVDNAHAIIHAANALAKRINSEFIEINLAIVNGPLHVMRAKALILREFYKGNPKFKINIFPCPFYSFWENNAPFYRKATGLASLLAEQLKLLYMVLER